MRHKERAPCGEKWRAAVLRPGGEAWKRACAAHWRRSLERACGAALSAKLVARSRRAGSGGVAVLKNAPPRGGSNRARVTLPVRAPAAEAVGRARWRELRRHVPGGAWWGCLGRGGGRRRRARAPTGGEGRRPLSRRPLPLPLPL